LSSARIDVDADLQGSLMGDIARAPAGALGDVAPGLAAKVKPPVEVVHGMNKKKVSGDYADYKEQPAKPFTSAVGEARISEFTGTSGGSFKEKIHGYRVTMLGGERAVTVISKCTEEDWPNLKAPFARVIQSVKPGGPG